MNIDFKAQGDRRTTFGEVPNGGCFCVVSNGSYVCLDDFYVKVDTTFSDPNGRGALRLQNGLLCSFANTTKVVDLPSANLSLGNVILL